MIRVLAKMLEMDEAQVRKKVEKVSSMERIRTNVAKETGDAIRSMGLTGEGGWDVQEILPLRRPGLHGPRLHRADNQGIIGLEVKYESCLKGHNGTILTDGARRLEWGEAEDRIEPVAGSDLQITLTTISRCTPCRWRRR